MDNGDISYTVYGPLAMGALVVFEGECRLYPDTSRFEYGVKHNVNIFYTAPTAVIRYCQWAMITCEKSQDLSMAIFLEHWVSQ